MLSFVASKTYLKRVIIIVFVIKGNCIQEKKLSRANFSLPLKIKKLFIHWKEDRSNTNNANGGKNHITDTLFLGG